MKNLIKLSILCATFYVSSAYAFLFFIPTGAISDAITGAEGKNCVANTANVGDKIMLANGKVGEIKSLSGTSTRCTVQTLPIRALVEPIEIPPVETSFTIQTPSGFETSTLTDINRFNGLVTQALQKDSESGFQVFSIPKHKVENINEYTEKKRAGILVFVTDGKETPILPTKINKIPALQFEVYGALKNGIDVRYLVTVLDGQDEVVTVILWTRIDSFESRKPEFISVLNTSGGIVPARVTGIVVEGSLEDRMKKCGQMGLQEKTKKFNDCLVMLQK